MWALHCCLNGISNNSIQETSNLFQTMFPGSKIAKSFQMEPNKTVYHTGPWPLFQRFTY